VKASVLVLAAAVARLLLVLAGRGRVKAILLVKAGMLTWRRVSSVARRH
jgi:hypothetical protein